MLIGAALQACKEKIPVRPRLLIPTVFSDHEVAEIVPNLRAAANSVLSDFFTESEVLVAPVAGLVTGLHLSLGSAVELPRACIRADRIAQAGQIEFLSINSNKLTQCIFGCSKEDSYRFMVCYCHYHFNNGTNNSNNNRT